MLLLNILSIGNIIGGASLLCTIGMFWHVVNRDKKADWTKKADIDYVNQQDRSLHYRIDEVKKKQAESDARINEIVRDMHDKIIDIHKILHNK